MLTGEDLDEKTGNVDEKKITKNLCATTKELKLQIQV